MTKTLKQAIAYVRRCIDMEAVRYAVNKSMELRCPAAHIDHLIIDDITDLMEEYSDDYDLPEGWWLNEMDEEDIIREL